MIAVFRCIHRNILFFIGIGLVLSTKSRNAGYNDQGAVVYIIYQELNSRKVLAQRSKRPIGLIPQNCLVIDIQLFNKKSSLFFVNVLIIVLVVNKRVGPRVTKDHWVHPLNFRCFILIMLVKFSCLLSIVILSRPKRH